MTALAAKATLPTPASDDAGYGDRPTIRLITPSDHTRFLDFLGAIAPEDLRSRTMGTVASLTEDQISELLAVDGRRLIALAAIGPPPNGAILGIVRAVVSEVDGRAEFAILVRSRLKRRGLGAALLSALLDRLREQGVGTVVGDTFADNDALLALARSAGFRVVAGEDGSTRQVTLALDASDSEPQTAATTAD